MSTILDQLKIQQRIMVQRYTGKEEMIDLIRNTTDSLSYYGNDEKSDLLDCLVQQLKSVDHYATIDVLYFICLLRDGVGSLTKELKEIKEISISVDEYDLSEYSGLSIDDSIQMSVDFPSPIAHKLRIIPKNTLHISNEKEIAKMMSCISFWKHDKVTELQFIKHVLLCMIMQQPIGDLYFTKSRSSSNFFQNVVSNVTALKNAIEASNSFLFMRKLFKYINQLIMEFQQILISEFESLARFWHCTGSLRDAPFFSIITIHELVVPWQVLFQKLSVFNLENPISIAFQVLSANLSDPCFRKMADIIVHSENGFAIDCCSMNTLILPECENLLFYNDLFQIHSEHSGILSKINANNVTLEGDLENQFKLILAYLKAKSNLQNEISKSELEKAKNKYLSCLVDPAILHVIDLVCNSFIIFCYDQSLTIKENLLSTASSGTIPIDIDIEVVDDNKIDASYKMPTLKLKECQYKLKFDVKGCVVAFEPYNSEIKWLNDLLHCKVQECLTTITKRIIKYSKIPCLKKYMIYVTVQLNKNNEYLEHLTRTGASAGVISIQQFLIKLMQNGASPSDVVRQYDLVNL